MKEALFYEKLDDGKVRCNLCRHYCLILPGKRGICGVRENRDGILLALVYGKLVAEHVDPVEKKPLFHFKPGSRTYSIATVGCNFRCQHCQNYSISQVPDGSLNVAGNSRTPEDVVRSAIEAGCSSISYTYTEPTIFLEFALDTARLAHQAGLSNIFVTNGYITPEALDPIAPYLDAANIDLKGFSEEFYRKVAGASLEGVMATIRDYVSRGIWVELTTLLITGLNDSDHDLEGLTRFIAEELGAAVPWHISRFFPTYLMTDRQSTPVETLYRAASIGKQAGLEYIYMGNVSEPGSEDTVCPSCASNIIVRAGFNVPLFRLNNDCCPDCGKRIAGIWS